MVPCASCYNRLSVAQYELENNEKLKDDVLTVVGLPYLGTVKSLECPSIYRKNIYWIYCRIRLYGHLLIRWLVIMAVYYFVRIKVLKFDRLEDPQSMDKIMSILGANPIDWAFKTECCGAGLSVSRTDLVGRLSGNILKDASDRGAEAVIVACPMCHSNLICVVLLSTGI